MGLIIGQGKSGGGGYVDVTIQPSKDVEVHNNGRTTIVPDEGYDAIKRVNVTTNIPLQKKTIEITESGEKTLTPDSGFEGFSQVNLNVKASSAHTKAATLDGWSLDLYDVLATIKKDERYQGMVACAVCSFLNTTNSVTLGSANAFITSDGAYYTTPTTHTFDKSKQGGKVDVWVAYLFASENTNLSFAESGVSKILVDGILGTIDLGAFNGVFTSLETTDGSSILQLKNNTADNGTYTQPLSTFTYLGRIRKQSSYFCVSNVVRVLCADIEELNVDSVVQNSSTLVEIVLPSLTNIANGGICSGRSASTTYAALKVINAPVLSTANRILSLRAGTSLVATNVQQIILPSLKSIAGDGLFLNQYNLTSDNGIVQSNKNGANCIKIEIGDGYNSHLNLRTFSFANCIKTDANDLVEDLQANPMWSNLDQFLYNFEHYIVDKLADLSGQTQRKLTLYNTVYDVIPQSIKDKLTAKNWNFVRV